MLLQQTRTGERVLGRPKLPGRLGPRSHRTIRPRATGAPDGFGFATDNGYPINEQYAYCTVLQSPCPSGDLQGWYVPNNPYTNYFDYWLSSMPAKYARFFIPYDALYYENTSTNACDWSPASASTSQTGATVSGSTQMTLVSSSSAVIPGMYVWGPGVPPEDRVDSVSGTLVQLDQPATSTNAGTSYTFMAPGLEAYYRLIWDVQAAQADGLTPVVAFTNGTGLTAGVAQPNPVPSVPDPGYGTSSTYPLYTWTTAGLDYYCGVDGLMGWIATAGLGSNPVTNWEAWNEPNGSYQDNSIGGGYGGALGPCPNANNPAPSCEGSSMSANLNPASGYPNGPCGSGYYTAYSRNYASGTTVVNACGGQVDPSGNGYLCYGFLYTPCGPLEAFELWQLASYVNDTLYKSRGMTIAALTLSNAENYAYENSYIQNVVYSTKDCSNGKSSYGGYYCGDWPSVWAVHDYNDPSSGTYPATGDINSFTSNLNSNWGGSQIVWITESAINLNDGATGDANSQATGCNDGESDHYNSQAGKWTFGGCVDHTPMAQLWGADSFLQLQGTINNETISQADWYEFQAANRSTGYDSGLLSPAQEGGCSNSPPFGVPFCVPSGGSYSTPRYSLCEPDHLPYYDCSSSAVDAEDWSTWPPGPTAGSN